MIRPAEKTDLQEILTIYNHAILHTTSVYSYEPHTLDMRETWYTQKLEANHPILVFEEDNHVIGFATYGSFRAWPAYQYSIEHSIYVDPNQRKKGIASQLLTEIIALAKQNGYKTMIAGIDASNEQSIGLHKKFGFTYSGTIEKAGYKFDRWLDLAFYQLIFDSKKS
ncbi:GNAT family N-acetyltransferase [Alkalihalobacillus sp. LMS6]|uniref:GNAT family N-acetyltransferase n=1 Tax=Alkalihalobacillus sp. LMS6 TaxID=2924034 RepID=UPI0020D117A3|nr:GNAT family N-acetyltransferase [Alkalihalobacillus sp. LMS6]UTR08200.1 GNAT family N-acetyltransferase [Alkalihalobacillus sp. LMS6]